MVYQNKDKDGKIIKTKDGRSWYFRQYYTDMNGKRKRKKSPYYLLKKEAEDAEAQFLISSKKEDRIEENPNFEKVYSEWLSFKEELLKVTSYYRIKKTADKHILKHFENVKLHSIKINILMEWKKNLENKGLSLPYQNKIIGNMQEILDYAIEEYNFDKKVLKRLKKHRIDSIIKKSEKSKTNYWTFDEFNSFINCVDNPFYNIVFNFMYYTGVRMGELIALTWNDIDFGTNTININKSFSNKVEGKKYVITAPKTPNSNRIIDLDDKLVELLKSHLKNEENIYNFKNDMFVFGNARYLPPTTLARNLKKFIKISGVRYITIHGFRHSHVSLLINFGCDSRDVAERIGDTVEVVEKTYYHMFPAKKSNAVNILNNIKNMKNGT